MTSAMPTDCDVLIVGGGAVGSALGCALAELPLDIVLVEAEEVRFLDQPSFDSRVIALANGSQKILAGIGLWPELEGYTEAIRCIHVSERGQFGAARILAAEERVPALGYTIESQVLGRVLWTHLQATARLEVLAPARVTGLELHGDHAALSIERAGQASVLRAKLVVAADGARSAVRDALAIDVAEHDYEQCAVIFNCTTAAPLGGRAFERFTAEGPIALLPLTGGRAAVIWTLPAATAKRMAALPTDAFRDELQTAFGQRLGRFARIGARQLHPLTRVSSGKVQSGRVVLIGDAALRTHPVAGQGFNLALRDIATLAEVIADGLPPAQPADASPDVGALGPLERYVAWRAADRGRVAAFTHGLIQLFGEPAPGLAFGRGLGLMAFDLLPGAKGLLARHTMGRAGRLPRLARGLRLT